MYCEFIRQRVHMSNIYRLTYHFSKIVACLRLKDLAHEFIVKRKFMIKRVHNHQANVKKNKEKFIKAWDKQMLNLISFKDKSKKKNLAKLDDLYNNIKYFSVEFKDTLFHLYYNISLIPYLQKNYDISRANSFINITIKSFAETAALRDRKKPRTSAIWVPVGKGIIPEKTGKKLFDIDDLIKFKGMKKNLSQDK